MAGHPEWHVCPVLRVADVRAAVDHYRAKLGFGCGDDSIHDEEGGEGAIYAIVRRGDIAVHLGRRRDGIVVHTDRQSERDGWQVTGSGYGIVDARAAAAMQPTLLGLYVELGMHTNTEAVTDKNYQRMTLMTVLRRLWKQPTAWQELQAIAAKSTEGEAPSSSSSPGSPSASFTPS